MASDQNQQSLSTIAQQWPTPTSRDHRSLEASEATHDRNARPLSEFMGMWSTPRASDGEKGGPDQSFTTGMIPPLPAQAAQWPTPTSLSFRDSHQPGNSYSYNETMRLASSLLGRPTPTDGEPSLPEIRRLNPRFVEWLMGWPPGWTSFECSETALYRFRRRMRSAFWQLGLPPEDQPAQMSLF